MDDQEYVLDANVFIHAVDLSLPFENPVTTPGVVEELESEEPGKRFEFGDVDVYQPSPDALDRVREEAERMGEDVSDIDVEVLALALERDATVVSDDYAVQNLASRLGIEYEGFAKDEIEDEDVEWRRVCRNCGA
ncbi:MAG: NOB1 family endonuclease, partial [Candidatus Nanohaloarchaea archaeon]